MVLIGLLALLLIGCGQEKMADVEEVAVFTAPAETVLARVGERVITVGDYRKRLAFETAVYRLTMMNSKSKPKDAEKRLAGFERSRLCKVLPQLVHIALLDNYLESSCGGPAVKDESAIVARSVKRVGGKIGRKSASLEEVAAEIGVEPDYLKRQFLIPTQETKARMCFDPACTNVTEKEIDEGLQRIDAYTARAVASNQVTRATCEKTLAEVRKPGVDFAVIAQNCGADNPKEANEWGWFNRDDFGMMARGCPAFKQWAFTAKVGDIGGPFDIDDGLSIVKLVGHQDGSEEDSMASKQVEEVQLVRINFVMFEEHPEPRTREHCRSALLTWKAQDAQNRLFTKLFNETKIDYPSGSKLNFQKQGQ